MSAIAAIASFGMPEDAKEVVNRMCEVMSDRGPHGRDIKVVQNACFGHNLHLYDRPAEDAEKGIFSDGETGLTVLLDGELYNCRELAEELECGKTDELVILKSYNKFGRDCLNRFRGAFSFIIWNDKESVLFAARDFYGEKPLFYNSGADGSVTIASAIRGVLRNGSVPREIDYEAVSHYLYEKAFILPDTPLKHVKTLMNGGWLEWSSGEFRTGKYWSPPYFPEKIDDEEYVVNKYSDLLLEAISKRLPKDSSSPGLLYSGGTDSNLILGMLGHVTDRKVTTFSVIEGMSDRDLKYARNLASRFGANHVEMRVSADSLKENLHDLIWTHVTPGVSIVQAFFGTKESSKHGVNVAYTGLGVEPTLEPLWYVPYLEFLEKAFSPFRILPERSRENIYELMYRVLRGKGSTWGKGKPHRAMNILYYYFMYKRGHFRWYGTGMYPDRIQALFSKDIDRRKWKIPADGYREVMKSCPVDEVHDVNNAVFLSKGLSINTVPKFESAAAFNNVLMRFPYLDQDVTEFTLKIPYDLKYRDGMSKFPVRKNCRTFVSDECATLGKQDFNPPFKDWMTGGIWPVIKDVLSREAVEKRGIFDYDRLWPIYERFKVDPGFIPWADIWAPVTLELWLRMHVDPPAGDTSKPLDIF